MRLTITNGDSLKERGYCFSVMAFYLRENDNTFPAAQDETQQRKLKRWHLRSVWKCNACVFKMKKYVFACVPLYSRARSSTKAVKAQHSSFPQRIAQNMCVIHAYHLGMHMNMCVHIWACSLSYVSCIFRCVSCNCIWAAFCSIRMWIGTSSYE